MKLKVLFLIAIAATAVLSSTARADNTTYNMIAERMFEGIAASAGHVVDGIVFFPLKTEDRVVEVELGPKDFVGKSGFNVKPGEMVSVVGSPTMVGKREIVLAREVWTMRTILVLRDRMGRPLWDVNRPVEMDPEVSESNLCEMILP